MLVRKKVIKWSVIPMMVIFTLPARKPAHNNGCVPLPQKGWTPLFRRKNYGYR